MVILALGLGVDSILGHLLGAAVGELPAVSGRHKATSVPAAQGRPPLEINATYGGSTDLKNNNFFFNWVDPVNKGGGKAVCCLGRALWVCDLEPELTSEEVVCCDGQRALGSGPSSGS